MLKRFALLVLAFTAQAALAQDFPSRPLRASRTGPVDLSGLMIAAAGPAAGQAISSARDLESFAERYYLKPEPDRVSAAIAFLGTTDLLSNRSSESLYLGFFANVFARHPDRVADWRSLIDQQNPQTRDSLRKAMNAPPELQQVIASQAPTPGRNDLCWGAFFATGDPRQVAPVIDALKFIGERRDEVLFAAAGTAKWSLALQARKHPVVQQMLGYVIANFPPLRDEIADVIAKEPDRIRQDIASVMRSQHANGLWLDRGAVRTPNARLSFLLGLPQTAATPAAEVPTKAKEAFARAVEGARTADSYCSQYVVKDFTLDRLKNHGYFAYGARLDYAAPDRYHVTQQAWAEDRGKYVFDEWVSMADENFQNMGLWFRSTDRENAAQNQNFSLNLLARKLARIGAATPERVDVPGAGSYWLFTLDELQRRSELADLDLCGPLAVGSCDLLLWVDASSETIAKAKSRLRGTGKDGKNLHLEIDQVFGCQGEPIAVNPPPRLNAVRAADGKLTITDTDVAAMPHHGGELHWSLDSGLPGDRKRGASALVVAHKPPTGAPLARPPYAYMHYYRTEVQNASGHPLKIVWFNGFTESAGKWVGGRLAGSGPLESRFSAWYSEGERTVDGVIPPGKTAVDGVNWTGSSVPGFVPQKWAYVAVDAEGNVHYAEAVVDPSLIRSIPPASSLH